MELDDQNWFLESMQSQLYDLYFTTKNLPLNLNQAGV